MAFQLHVTNDVRANRTSRVRQRGAAEARIELLGNRCAAGLLTTLEYQRLESRLGQVERGDQTVVTATDDDDVAPLGHDLGHSLEVFENLPRRQSSRRSHDAAAWMCSRTTHVKILDGGAELRPARHRTQKEKLLKR